MVLNAETSATVASVRVCGSPLSCLAYNPGTETKLRLFCKLSEKRSFSTCFMLLLLAAGDVIAVGSQNGSVYLFRVSRDGYSYKRAHKIRGSQPLTQLDWSTDGGFLQTATEDYDLTFCKTLSLTLWSRERGAGREAKRVVVCRGREGAVRGEEPRGHEGRQVVHADLLRRLHRRR